MSDMGVYPAVSGHWIVTLLVGPYCLAAGPSKVCVSVLLHAHA